MIPSLEELRKRLLNRPGTPPGPAPSGKRPTFASSGRVCVSPLRRPDKTIYLGDASAEHCGSQAEAATTDEKAEEAEIQTAEFATDAELVEAATAFFRSADGYRQHLAQLADVSSSLNRLGRVADKVLEPLKGFRGQVQALLDFYVMPGEPGGVLRERLDSIVWLSSTQKPSRSRDDAAAAAFGRYLFEISRSLARAKALHTRLVELARAFHAADALQGRLRALSYALDAGRTSKTGNPARGRAGANDQN